MTQSGPMRSRGGVAPYGYRWNQGRLVLNETEAPVRRLIFDLFLKHRRKKTVARILNDLGYRTRNKAKFSDTGIDRLLKDPTAKGVRHEGDIKIEVERVVSDDIWERANRLLGASEKRRPTNPFIGRVVCSCGKYMTVPSESDKYVCSDCHTRIPAEDLEYIFLSQVETFRFGNFLLLEKWPSLRSDQKQRIIEHLCEEILVARESISIRFACDFSAFKTTASGQHTKRHPATVKEEVIEVSSPAEVSEPLMSELEAAKFLGISKMTLLRKRNTGLIGFFRVGFRVLYSKEKHLLPYLAACEVQRPGRKS